MNSTDEDFQVKHNLDVDIDQYVKREMQNSLFMSTGFDPAISNRQNFQKAVLLASMKKQQITWNSQINFNSSRSNLEIKIRTQQVRDLAEHKNAKTLEKISVVTQKNYYQDLPIKPGFLFIDSILKAPRGNYRKLEVNIPESLYYSDKLYFIHTSNGHLNCTTDINGYNFMKIVEKYRVGTSEDSVSVIDKVAAILRGKGESEGDMHKILLDWNQFKVKMISNEYSVYSILQRYIRSPGGRPTLTRLYYHSYQKGNKANFAYFITSKFMNSEHESVQKCMVDTSLPETIDVFTKSGVALKPFEKEAEKIVNYLNKGYNLRIEEIILDFVKDENNVIWLISCKALRVDPSTKACCLTGIKEWWPDLQPEDYKREPEEKVKEGQEESKNGLMSFVHCKLCRLYYQNNELSHLVSVRMLMLYKVHVNRRMDLTWDTSHLKISSNTMLSQSVRVCQYCYMLVTTEFELMRVEEELGKVLSVPYVELGYEEDPRLLVQLQFLPKQLVQWRILFFCTKIFEYEKLPKSFFIHLNFAGHITSFFINNPPITNEYEPYIPISIARMHYLFSSPDKSIKSFLTMFVFEMQITEGEKFDEKVIAETKGKILSDLPSYMSIPDALYQKKQMVFFNLNNEAMCNLSINVGISCDKLFPSKKIKVLMNKQRDIYIPESHFMTTDPLPEEWMELFGYQALDETTFGPQVDEEKFYCPQMSRLEMLRMEDITSPYRKLHSASYDHIASKVLRPATAKLPEADVKKEAKSKKRISKLVVTDRIEGIPEEITPFYKVVSEYLRSRPVTAIIKRRKNAGKQNETKRSFASTNLETWSTLVTPTIKIKTDRQAL